MKTLTFLAAALCVGLAGLAHAADTVIVPVNKITAEGVGEKAGTIELSSTGTGVSMAVDVTGVPDGEHGFHVHEKCDCRPGMKDGKEAAGIAAGGHFDPASSKSHKGPDAGGHEGDLPKLMAKDQAIKQTVSLSKLKMADLTG